MKASTNVIGAISRMPTRFTKPRAPVYFVDPDTGDVLELCFNTATFTSDTQVHVWRQVGR